MRHPEPTPLHIAVHECGHAVVAILNGIPFEFVEVSSEDPDSRDRVRSSNEHRRWLKDKPDLHIRFLAGGPAAEFVFVQQSNPGCKLQSYALESRIGWKDDVYRIAKLRKKRVRRDAGFETHFALAESSIEEAIAALRPQTSATIEILARALHHGPDHRFEHDRVKTFVELATAKAPE